MKYLICLDLDGTTLNAKSKISIKTKNYLKELKKDHIICLITGRPTRASLMFYDELGLDTIMGNYNGTKLSMPHNPNFKTIYNGMDNHEVLAFMNEFKEEITSYILNVDDLAYISKKGGEVDSWTNFSGIVTDVNKLNDKFDGAVFAIKDSAVDKVKAYFKEPHLISPRIWHTNTTFDNVSNVSLLELHDNYFNKGTAVDLIKEYYKDKFDKVIAIGDSTNDLDMLKKADIPVAMKNAHQEAKDLAKIIAPKNTYNGVMKVLQQIIKNA